MIKVILYSRPGCHLCEVVEEDLQYLQKTVPHEVIVIDIDENASLRKQYGEQIPVVKIGPYTLKAPIDIRDLEITLQAAITREEEIEAIDSIQIEASGAAAVWTKADGFSYWLSKRYLLLLNLIVVLYVGLPFLAPVLMNAGAEAPARLIYRAFGVTCHQLAFRSWFLFGEQIAYPKASAGMDQLISFDEATAIDSEDLYAAREFIGNPTIGYKIALCERDVSIYGAILLFGVIFSLTGRRLPGLPWYFWIILGIAPVALDGLSQFLSQPPLSILPYRESTPMLRLITGGLFGFTTAWFGYPMVEEAMGETRYVLESKKARIARLEDRKSQG
jgi:uncharacterized membrane protein